VKKEMWDVSIEDIRRFAQDALDIMDREED